MNIIDSFKYLVALEQHKHFSRAAQACHITQPALSNAIKALEDEMNIKIVNRGRNYEGLTLEGNRVLAAAYQVLHEMNALKQEIKGRKHEPRGELVIGSIPSALPIAANFSVLLQDSFQGLRPVLRSMASHEIELGLEKLSIDLAFGYIERPQLDAYEPRILPQYHEEYFLITKRERSEEKFVDSLSWQEASALPLCLLTPEMHNRVLVENCFKKANVSVTPAMETDSIFTLLLCIQAAGQLATILSGPMANVAVIGKEFSIRRLTDPLEKIPVGILMPSGRQLTIIQETAHKVASSKRWHRILKSISVP